MTPMSRLVRRFLPDLTNHNKPPVDYDSIDFVSVYNSRKGDLDGEHCEKCNDKGVFYYRSDEGEIKSRECECMETRRKVKRSIRLINNSGLKDTIRLKTFDNFEVNNDFQRGMKSLGQDFLKSDLKHWLFIGGQVGAGKTHICTAVVGELLLNCNKETRYLQWREDVPKLKAKVNADEYQDLIGQYKSTEVLYIDDLFKTDTDRSTKITTGDINIAFEILNWRYQNRDLITIISSQLTVAEIVQIDEAIGSRIFERSEGFRKSISRDISKNYRLRGM